MTKGKRILSATNIALLAAGLFFLSLLIAIMSTNNQRAPQQNATQQTAPQPPRSQRTASSSPSGTPSARRLFPPLRITASGRLPDSLQGFKLGMDFSEALQRNPELDNSLGGAVSLNPWDEALVHEKTGEGVFVEVDFVGGRAIKVHAEVSEVSPDDAEAVENITFDELGRPDVDIDERDRVYPARRWVWVDGDVRIAYERRTQENGARDLSLDLVAYPTFIAGAQASSGPPDHEKDWQELVRSEEEEWGNLPKPSPYASKPLPSGLEGLELGESPSQVLALFPGATMNSTPDETYNGSYRLSNGNEIRFGFFDNKLESICEDRFDIPPQRFDEFRNRMTDQFGETTSAGFLGQTGWTNEKVNFYYLINKDESKPGKRPLMVTCIEDKQLMSAEHQQHASEYASPPHYEKAPVSNSFFLPADLATRR